MPTEGFDGGERSPVAITATSPESNTLVPGGGTMSRKLSQGTKSLLKWASHGGTAYEQTSKRGYAVSELYPRIFYAFSDVIMFVLDSPK